MTSHTHTFPQLSACALFAVALTGCMVGPKYKKPTVPAYTAPSVTVDKSETPYKEADPNWRPATPEDATLRGDWWTVFHNDELNLLEVKAGIQNQTLADYAARYEAAEKQIGINRSQLFPQIGTQALAQGVRYSAGRPYFTAPGTNPGVADIQLPLTASWEVDLWGRIRRQVNIAKEETQATAADRENAQLSVQTELAVDYFEVRADDAQARLLDNTVKDYEEALRITTNRFEGGISNESDVFQAKTQLQAAVVQLQDIQVARAQNEHAIAVLIGQPPNSFSLAPQPLESTPPGIPAGLPSQLLERRPDIAAAERRAAEANQQIGIARAAYFPTVGLSAAGGFESGSLANFFSASNLVYAIGPTVNYNIFDFGLRSNTSAQTRAQFQQSSADYRQTVLTAFQQVEGQPRRAAHPGRGGRAAASGHARRAGRAEDLRQPLRRWSRHLPAGRHRAADRPHQRAQRHRHHAPAHGSLGAADQSARRRLVQRTASQGVGSRSLNPAPCQ